jgi:hypothetical protein
MGAMLGLLLHSPAAAQAPSAPPRFSIEPHLSLAVPRGAVAERWGVGAGIGVQASVGLDHQYALYAGYSGTQFDLDFIDDMHAIDRGLAAGVVRSFRWPGGGALVPWVRAGVLAHRLSVVRSGDAGEERDPADGNVGFETGAGIRVQGWKAQAMLGLEYRGYSARVLGLERESVSYGAVRAGVRFAF